MSIDLKMIPIAGYVMTAILCAVIFQQNRSEWTTLIRVKALKEKQLVQGFKPTKYQMFESKYIDQSGLKSVFLNLRGWHLIVLSIGCCMLCGVGAFQITHLFFMVLPGCLLGGALPFKCIHFYKAYEDQSMRRELPLFFGLMAKWAAIQPEMIFCFNKILGADVHIRIKKTIRLLLSEIASGEHPKNAFEKVESQIGAGLFRDYFVCLKQLEQHSGDLLSLTLGFETEALHIEIEVSKRRAEMLKQNITLQVLNLFGIGFLFKTMTSNKVLSTFYIGTDLGNIVLLSVSTVFALFFIWSTAYLSESL